MNTIPRRDVIVVGGGPAGVAAAIFLRNRGHDVLLLDAARFPRDKVCGEGVSPEAWRLLDRLDAVPAVRALRPHPLRGMALTAPDGTTFRGDYGPAREPGFAASREALDHALLGRARQAGVEVRGGARVTALRLAGARGAAGGLGHRPGSAGPGAARRASARGGAPGPGGPARIGPRSGPGGRGGRLFRSLHRRGSDSRPADGRDRGGGSRLRPARGAYRRPQGL